MIQHEIEQFKNKGFPKEDNDRYGKDLLQQWVVLQGEFPCLYMVASALFAMMAGSGGLECNIGGFGRVIRPERSQLDAGMVEALYVGVTRT